MKNSPQKIAGSSVAGIFIVAVFFCNASVVSAAVPCTNLTSDISYGMTDSYSSGPILALQNFLLDFGYLSATPNGHFGPATLTAVTAFQVAQKISGTGFVGPLTRAAVAAMSCVSTSASATQSLSTTPSSNFIAPPPGTALTIGKNYTITWNSASQSGYSIVLENSNGLSQGFITPNPERSNSYNWQIGTIFSGATGMYTTVTPGTYQIHLYNISGSAPDILSGKFTIVAPPLTINSVIPLKVLSSDNPTVVLYGSGFNLSVQVSIDGYYNLSTNPIYTSPDGTVMVFSLPSGVGTGSHTVYVSNSYGSLATSPSFTVTQ